MLRHLNAALEARGQKRVYGLFILEGEGGPDAVEVPARWVDAVRNTISATAICDSPPHRNPAEQLAIARCFLGVTNWQAVYKTFDFDIDWTKLPDSVASAPCNDSGSGPGRTGFAASGTRVAKVQVRLTVLPHASLSMVTDMTLAAPSSAAFSLHL